MGDKFLMWAGLEPWDLDAWRYVHPHPEYVQDHGCRPIRVEVTVELTGAHWGWIDADSPDGAPTLIQPYRDLFEMQFSYGWKAEEDAGRGEMVRVMVVPVDRNDWRRP